VRSWASNAILGASRREALLRAGLAIVLLGAIFVLLPIRRAGEEGSVLCLLHLSEAGEVEQVEVIESSGFERLDNAACEGLLRWRFVPRRVDGRAVATTLLHRVTFELKG